jgi:two-component system, OmpR family, phosphate regulon response regulator PhoB
MSPTDPPTILVVDDHRATADLYRQLLESRGYVVAVAHGGDDALALFEAVRPALVLLDVMMPDRDGWTVCRLMKQHPELGGIVRVIMVTGRDDWRDKQDALQTGADDYLEKPISLARLAHAVERNLAQLRPAS